jgi:hypothetical protein
MTLRCALPRVQYRFTSSHSRPKMTLTASTFVTLVNVPPGEGLGFGMLFLTPAVLAS